MIDEKNFLKKLGITFDGREAVLNAFWDDKFPLRDLDNDDDNEKNYDYKWN